ncbi:glycosyltransferase family 1 protein [Belnapia sp. F-4-1]|uniref:glycosyltransferase family 4 protein n=1 Tax=Belnapia sp. F-4-1 TaxID=1545443 RepID=UPI00068E1B97|nr:glycosyltransferase family 1 protein [Belnapia sp. F-4-1]
MMIWCDVEDLFEYARSRSRPSGIQRLAYEVYVALRALSGDQVGFVRQDPVTAALRVVDWQDVEALYNYMSNAAPLPPQRAVPPGLIVPTALRGLARRVPDDVRLPLGRAARGQITAVRGVAQAAGAMLKLLRARDSPPSPVDTAKVTGRHLREVARPGDVLAVLGSPWSHPDYPAMVAELNRTAGLRFALLVYDLIPAIRPEYSAHHTVPAFLRFMRGCLPLADFIFAISKATAQDLTKWAERELIPLRTSPQPIPIGTEFVRPNAGTPLPGSLVPGGYALFVSTMEARKNHQLAFRAWRRLLDEMPAEQVPTLVFAGRIGWMVADLMQQIENSKRLDGKLVLVDNADDATLAALYAGARFTLFPSLYEGWGLPVSESLAFGKVCLASNRSSVPEAGGPFCLYHDPDSVTEAVTLYRRVLKEPEMLRALEQRIAAEHRPTAWSATARTILDAVGSAA